MPSAPALEIDANRSAQLSGAGRAPKKIDFPSRDANLAPTATATSIGHYPHSS